MKKSGVKLNQQIRSEIRKFYLESTLSLGQVATHFNVSVALVHKIVHEADGDINVVRMLRNKQLKANEVG